MENNNLQLKQMKAPVQGIASSETSNLEAMQVFFNLSAELFCIRNSKGYFSMLNPRWEEVLGWTPEELRSRPWRDFIHPQDLQCTLRLEGSCAPGNICYLNNRYQHKNGDYYWLSWRIWRHQNGSLYGAVRELDREQKIAQSHPFVQEGRNERVHLIRHPAKGENPEEGDDRHPSTSEGMVASFHRTNETIPIPHECHSHINSTLTSEERVQCVGDCRNNEAVIRQLTAELECRVADRNAELEAANRELETFCYSVSHDLRAPLRRIAGFVKALLEDYGSVLDETGQDYLKRMHTATQGMKQSIDALLELSRVTRTPMQRQPIDLSEMVRAIAAEIQQHGRDRQVKFSIADPIVVHADPYLVQVMLENLLGNAWKFTSKTPNPCIEFGVTHPRAMAADRTSLAQSDRETVYFIRDNGAGFDMHYADRLFVPFQRLHNCAEYEGTGIGLATVARIVARHGGQVWAIGAVGQGATVYFTLEFAGNACRAYAESAPGRSH